MPRASSRKGFGRTPHKVFRRKIRASTHARWRHVKQTLRIRNLSLTSRRRSRGHTRHNSDKVPKALPVHSYTSSPGRVWRKRLGLVLSFFGILLPLAGFGHNLLRFLECRGHVANPFHVCYRARVDRQPHRIRQPAGLDICSRSVCSWYRHWFCR